MNKTINSTGIAEIRDFLAARSNDPALYDSQRALNAWADEAEESLDAGNGAHIELRGVHSVSGCPETFSVSDAGIDNHDEP